MITNYDELKAAVISWLKRNDLISQTENFIQLAEGHFNRTVRAAEMTARAQIIVDSEFIALPDDLLSFKELHIEGKTEQTIDYITPQIMSKELGGGLYYTIIDGQIKLYPTPTPEKPIQLELIYVQKISPLSDTNPSNWLLENHPDIYLNAALAQAEWYLENLDKAMFWEQKTNSYIEKLNSESIMRSYGAAPLIPRMRS